jgi:hypothetical protein
MSLTKLNKLAKDFNIDPYKFGFYGEHDVVYLDVDSSKLPDATDWENEKKDEFYEKYGVFWIWDFETWGFFT